MNQKGFVKFIIILLVILAAIVGAFYWLNQQLKTVPTPVICTADAKQCPDGSFVGRTGRNCSFAACPKTTPATNGEKIIKKVGEQEGSFLVQKINADSVDGLWYQAYPVATNVGTPRTLHINDDIGYACEGISEKLTAIDLSAQTITFTKVVGKRPMGGCPI